MLIVGLKIGYGNYKNCRGLEKEVWRPVEVTVALKIRFEGHGNFLRPYKLDYRAVRTSYGLINWITKPQEVHIIKKYSKIPCN